MWNMRKTGVIPVKLSNDGEPIDIIKRSVAQLYFATEPVDSEP